MKFFGLVWRSRIHCSIRFSSVSSAFTACRPQITQRRQRTVTAIVGQVWYLETFLSFRFVEAFRIKPNCETWKPQFLNHKSGWCFFGLCISAGRPALYLFRADCHNENVKLSSWCCNRTASVPLSLSPLLLCVEANKKPTIYFFLINYYHSNKSSRRERAKKKI